MGNITECYSRAEVYIHIEMTSTYKNTFIERKKKEEIYFYHKVAVWYTYIKHFK